MARYQLNLAYDGTHFSGFQRQGVARTVQAVVEQALRKLGWRGGTILYAGRTDAGVHASGQVIAFDLDWRHPLAALGRALNANLPDDVAVKNVREAVKGFHPRYDARARTYCYRLYAQPQRDPLLERYAWRVDPPLAEELVCAAAQLLVGTHDFKAFGTALRKTGNTIRSVLRAEWEFDGNYQQFVISANAFLYHMVRRAVYQQVLVGQGKLTLDAFQKGVESGSPLPPGMAPPQGLTLVEVDYDRSAGI